MATIVNTKLGEHRGRKRVYLQGQKLEGEKFTPGKRYDVFRKDSQVLLKITEDGKYKVSRKNRNGRELPVIDLTAYEVAETFGDAEMLRVAIMDGRIVISVHFLEEKVERRETRMKHRIFSGDRLRTASFFHGGGVLDSAIHAGLKDAGVDSKISIAIEQDGTFLDASLKNNPQLWDYLSVPIESPIQLVRTDQATEVDVCIAGIPCEGASIAGRTKNKLEFAESHETAGSMFYHFLSLVTALNPAVVVIENVEAYASTSSMAVIRSVLKELKYSLSERVFEGNEFGVLESRKRLCVVAFSDGLANGFDLDQVLPVREKESCISEILEDVPLDSDRWKSMDYLKAKEKRDQAAGKGFKRQLLTGGEPSCATINKSYAKLQSTGVFLVHPEDPELSRIFTPKEHARCKACPESIVDGLSDTIAHQLLGQAVCFPVFQAVGYALGSMLDSRYGMDFPQVA